MPYDYDYFISYAHKDNKSPDGNSGFVDEFYRSLLKDSEDHQRLFGGKIRVFFDKSDIRNMSDWDNRIRASLASSRFLIVLLSPNYFKSEYCAKEFDWWMQHEMHRCTLGEGTAPMIICNVGVFDPGIEPAPEISPDLQLRFPNWLKQIRTYQSDHRFDMHDFLIEKIGDVLKTLRDEVKDKVRHQNIVDHLPYDTYPGYNENFVGRRENLLAMRKYMSEKSGKVITALTGIGGFGKTELALTYGHAFGWDYQLGRFFKPCENCRSISEALLTCGVLDRYGWKLKGSEEEQLLALFENLRVERDKIIAQNEETGNLRTEGAHVLLILDNVNNLDLISQLLKLKLPDFIHVIITTRENTNTFTGIHTQLVERLSEDESVELLSNLRPFGVTLPEDASDAEKTKADEDAKAEAEAARKIAQLLAGFTLTVELTGKYLYQNRENPFVTYRSQYERLIKDHAETFQKMADETGDLTRHAAETVAAVMESTLSAISDNTRKALEFASLMAPDAVALTWLPELCGLNEDEGVKVFDELTGYSLLAPLENERNIGRIHRLVAETVKKDIPEETQKEITSKIREKCKVLLNKDKTFWGTPENSWNITPVSEFCLTLAELWTVEASEEEIDWDLSRMLGISEDILKDFGKINEARIVGLCISEINEERGKTFPSSVGIQVSLSASYMTLGSLELIIGNVVATRMWFEKAMEIATPLAEIMSENVPIKNILSTLYKQLGILESTTGNIASAREWYKKDLEISTWLADKMPDDVHVQHLLVFSYNRLGDMEKTAGNTSAAREWYEKALEINLKLVDMFPEDTESQMFLVDLYKCLSNLEKTTGNIVAARDFLEKGLVINQRLVQMMPMNFIFLQNLSVMYGLLGDLEVTTGNTVVARVWYEKALEINQQWAVKMPESIFNSYRSYLYRMLGNLDITAGNTDAALKYFEKALEIDERLAKKMPDNVEVQRGLSVSYSKLGNLEKAAGNASAARKWYEKALEIYEKLAKKMPEDVTAQRAPSIIYERLGDMEKAAGNTSAAREWYEKDLEISKRLAEKMPDDVVTQRNLSFSYNRLGDMENAAGNTAAAREWYEKALEICKRLAEKMPDAVGAQGVLSISYNKLGDLENTAGNTSAAREWYEKALEIRERLAEKMPDDVGAQGGVSISYERLGDLENAAGNTKAAKEWYLKAFEIRQKLAESMPENFMTQEDLADIFERLGTTEKTDGQTAKARECYEKALEIYKKWAKHILENAEAQKDLATLYHELGDLEETADRIEAAREWYGKALEIRQKLVDQMPGNAEAQKDLAATQERLAKARKKPWYIVLFRKLFGKK